MIIRKNGTKQITKNFNESEFYSNSFNAPDEHYLADDAIMGAQVLRDFVDVPVKVNSTFRTPEHNRRVKGGTKSQHLLGTAIDLDCKQDALERAKESIRSKGELYQKLRAAGVTGIGLYPGFIHIDARTTGGIRKDNWGRFAFWDVEKIGFHDEGKKKRK